LASRTVSAKRKTELAEQLARTKVKKENQENIKAIRKTMETTNMLQMAQLYQSLGDEGKARDIDFFSLFMTACITWTHPLRKRTMVMIQSNLPSFSPHMRVTRKI
jgi:hypothetical protein